jgi:hypothetical protein
MMRAFLPASLMLVAAMAAKSPAQQPNNAARDTAAAEAPLSPEMWFYKQQLERYDNPKTAVRRNAEFQNQQRMARLETLKWYGFSNSRPTASPTPFMTMYSPAWQSNWGRPFAWYTSGRPTIIVSGRNYTP